MTVTNFSFLEKEFPMRLMTRKRFSFRRLSSEKWFYETYSEENRDIRDLKFNPPAHGGTMDT